MKFLVFSAITWAFVVSYDREVDQVRDVEDPGRLDDGNGGNGPSSCKDLSICGLKSGAYQLTLPSYGKASVYCHMSNLGACGGGGWTLVMKTDGTKRTFHYDSHLWTDNNTYNLPGGATGLDSQETKLPTYWTTPFTKICLGMKIGGQDRFILVHKAADSLYSLIADGQYRATSVGRLTWKSLIGSRASLQRNCNKEGFNLISTYRLQLSKARIGILGNEQNDCKTPDSRIGFGTGGRPADSNTCGNAANGQWRPDNGANDIKGMGYIFVQ